MQTNEAIKLWKELGITSCDMQFSCGGDSMNDYHFTFYKPNEKKGKNEPAVTEIDSKELNDYFDNEVFNNVEFYECSDGHYIGESGIVRIELDDESDDEEEHSFTYSKSAQSEWSERETNVIGITLTKKEIEFINNYVLNINGGDGDVIVNFKKDFIMTDEDNDLLEKLRGKINDETSNYSPDVDGELDDWYTFTTNNDESDNLNEIKIVEKKLQVEVSNSYIVYRDNDF